MNGNNILLFIVVVALIATVIYFATKTEEQPSKSNLFNGEKITFLNFGLQSDIPFSYMVGGTNTNPKISNNGDLGDLPKNINPKDLSNEGMVWVITPLGNGVYTIKVDGDFKYSYLYVGYDKNGNPHVNVTDDINDQGTKWIIEKAFNEFAVGNDKNGVITYIIKNQKTSTYLSVDLNSYINVLTESALSSYSWWTIMKIGINYF